MVFSAKSSHIASALSIVDIVSVLYGATIKQSDKFILSKGHACIAVYGALAEIGILDKAELESFGKDFSRLMAHISHHAPGVEFSTGSLGHGLPFGAGKAMAARLLNKASRVFVLLSDGELAEGSNWEAINFASHHKLSNLLAIVDYNKLQSLGLVEDILSVEPISDRFKSFGWDAIEVDGHDHKHMIETLESWSADSDRPTAIIAHTIKGKGISFMENNLEWHYRPPNDEEFHKALSEVLGAQ
jgi:transketolase